ALLLLRRAEVGEDLGVPGVRGLAAEDQRGPRRAAEDLVEQRQLELPVSLPAELGTEVGGPQPALPDLLLQRVDDLPQAFVRRAVLQPAEGQVERLDLVPDERVGPVELGLVLGIGLEIPRHRASLVAVTPWEEYNSGDGKHNSS